MTAIANAAGEPTEANVRALVELMSPRREHYAEETARRMAFIARPRVLETQRKLHHAREAAKLGIPESQRAPLAVSAGTLPDKLRAFSGPIALIWGEHERFNPGDLGPRIKTVLPPRARYDVIKGAGHNVHYDEPRRVATVLREFLD
jgi:pimeloyl-ACP methyl ester carboxylesterase